MKSPSRLIIWDAVRSAIQVFRNYLTKWKSSISPRTVIWNIFRSIARWLLIHIVPAFATGLIFAAALGRYTTETQFAKDAFQNYLRPYQTQYRSCLLQMDALRERWENLELMLKFTAENTDPSASAPIVVFTYEGSISVAQDDDAEKVLGKIVVSSRRASACIDETIRQAAELATLLGRNEWFTTDISNRDKRMSEYQNYIYKTWASIDKLEKWEIVEATIKQSRDGEPASPKIRSDAQKYQAAVTRFRAHLLDVHVRHKDWLEKLDADFRDELAARSSRNVGFYLRNIFQDIFSFTHSRANSDIPLPEPSLAWTTATEENPPSADCNCGRPFASGSYQRLGDPP